MLNGGRFSVIVKTDGPLPLGPHLAGAAGGGSQDPHHPRHAQPIVRLGRLLAGAGPVGDSEDKVIMVIVLIIIIIIIIIILT